MATGSTGSLFPRWQLAVLLGAPVAIGLGYLYYRSQTTTINGDGTKKDKKPIGDLKGQTISLDGDDKPTVSVDKTDNIEVAIKLTPLEEATKYKNEGNTCFKKGKYDEAIEYYDKAIDTCPRSNAPDLSTFYQNRAAAYEQLKKWSSVKSDCSKALELNSRYVKALHRRARANEYIGDLAASLEDVTATCILEGFQNNNSLVFADRVLKQMGRDDARNAIKTRKPSFPSPHYIKTYFASFTQDPLKKIVVASGEPNGFIRAKQAFDAGRYEEIIEACTEEIESSESEAEYKNEAFLLRGTFHLLRGSLVEAKSDFDVLISNPDIALSLKVNALIKNASANVQDENVEKGFENFAEAERLNPNNPDIYHQRGQVYVLMEKLNEAIRDFTEAVRLTPDHGTILVQKTFAQYRNAFLNQDEISLMASMNDFKFAIEKFPDCVECYSVMAQVLTEQGQYDQADSYFDKAMKMAPANATMYVHRAVMQLQWNGDIQKALDLMHKGIEIDDKCEMAYETLGTIEVQRGNLEQAIELFEKALSLAKTEAEMVHLYALRNAAVAQINVAKKLGIDMSALSALAAAHF